MSKEYNFLLNATVHFEQMMFSNSREAEECAAGIVSTQTHTFVIFYVLDLCVCPFLISCQHVFMIYPVVFETTSNQD